MPCARGNNVCTLERGIKASPGIPPKLRRRVDSDPALTPQEALEKAIGMVGQNTRAVLLCHGGGVLPLISETLCSVSA